MVLDLMIHDLDVILSMVRSPVAAIEAVGVPVITTSPDIANALFIISRVPGIAAQAQEERAREHPMRQIDPKDHLYDGAGQRRLPDKRR